MMGAFGLGRGSALERILEKDMSSAARLGVLDEADGVQVTGSGFRMDGNDGAGVEDVCRFVDERESDGFRWREEGDSIRAMWLASVPFFECECR
jgi:hypothetical protein